MTGRVAGKVALVTGAGTGIGRAVCVRLAEEGAEVVVTSRNPEHVEETCREVERAFSRAPLGLRLDLAGREEVDRVVGEVAERLGRIDILSNNAGLDLPHSPSVLETTDEEWEGLFRVNMTGMFWACRAAVPHCPGVIDTPLTDQFLELADDPEALRAEYAAVSPFGRMGTPREVANCVLFLASDEASFVTGSALVVDGGTTATV